MKSGTKAKALWLFQWVVGYSPFHDETDEIDDEKNHHLLRQPIWSGALTFSPNLYNQAKVHRSMLD